MYCNVKMCSYNRVIKKKRIILTINLTQIQSAKEKKNDTAERINKFKELFGADGDIRVYFAPGRVNLIGEHTLTTMEDMCSHVHLPSVHIWQQESATTGSFVSTL